MKKILIVLNDPILLSVFKSWVFRTHKKDALFLAKDAKEAIQLMQTHNMDLFVSEVDLPEMDGLELLAGFCFYYPQIRIVVFTPPVSESVDKQFKQLTSFYFVKKPTCLKDLINLVTELETLELPKAADMVVADFLRLVELHQRTCLLAIEAKDKQKKGLLYFEHGTLYDAVCAELKAELAVLEVLTWEHVAISFKTLDQKQFRRQIQVALSVLIGEKEDSAIKQDEEPLDLTIESIIAEADAKIQAEEAKAEAEAKSKAAEVALAKAKAKVEAEAKAKIEAEAKAKAEAEAKAEIEALRIKIKALELDKVILKPLSEIDDYMAFTIFNIKGLVLAEHHICEYNIETIGVNAAIMINSALETISKVGLGTLNYIQVNSEQGIFSATWVIENQLIAAMLLMPDTKNLGLAKLNLSKVCELIRNQLN